jgi:hypothetical protein
MSFFCPSPVCLERERQRLTGERRKKKKEKEIEKERETNIEVSSISRSEFFGAIPLQPYNNRKNGLFVYLVLKIISNANMNSRLSKNWFLVVFPPNTYKL